MENAGRDLWLDVVVSVFRLRGLAELSFRVGQHPIEFSFSYAVAAELPQKRGVNMFRTCNRQAPASSCDNRLVVSCVVHVLYQGASYQVDMRHTPVEEVGGRLWKRGPREL